MDNVYTLSMRWVKGRLADECVCGPDEIQGFFPFTAFRVRMTAVRGGYDKRADSFESALRCFG